MHQQLKSLILFVFLLSGFVFVPDTAASQSPSRLSIGGELRLRYEGLSGQFRGGLNTDGGDQAVLSRVLVHARGRSGDILYTVELQDSRIYLDDEGTPIGDDLINPLDILEANIGLALDTRGSQILLGRFTQNIGSRRIFARNGFRNTINAFSGLNGLFKHGGGAETRAVLAFVVGREPSDRLELRRNRFEMDAENFHQRVWGLHHKRPLAALGATLELYSFGLFEDDTAAQATRNRMLITPGFRLLRKPLRGRWDFDFENVYQFGRSRRTAAVDDTENLDIAAHFHHAEIGYTFDTDWNLRLSAEYDFASGDGDASNGINGRFDTLFGVRRRTFGNTSLFGPLGRSNISNPGVRLSFKKGRTDGRMHVYQGQLDSATDSQSVARLIDPTGASGRNIGTVASGRVRFWAIPQALRLETGFGFLGKGRFARTAPGAPDTGNTVYGYWQFTSFF